MAAGDALGSGRGAIAGVGWLARALSLARSKPFGYAEVVVSNVAWAKVLLIIVSVGIAPIVEEFLFRGWL
jgi:membrane protease YdiL (CAAX protease family)